MPSWGNNDNAANAPYWAVNSTIVNATDTKINASAPTAANVALLYQNTSPDVYTTGETIGLFAVDAFEADVNDQVAHSGWVLRTVGSGGRAGRVQQEVLIATGIITDNTSPIYPDVTITRLKAEESMDLFAELSGGWRFSETPAFTARIDGQIVDRHQGKLCEVRLGKMFTGGDQAN
jgi:hypothetical protein